MATLNPFEVAFTAGLTVAVASLSSGTSRGRPGTRLVAARGRAFRGSVFTTISTFFNTLKIDNDDNVARKKRSNIKI